MSKLLGFYILTLAFSVHALVPVEGIIMGEADQSLQKDPLHYIFSDIYDRSRVHENLKLKLYHQTYLGGEGLYESCSKFEASTYSTPWQEKQAKRSMVATLQYLGLDATIKAIGALARRLEINESDFERLSGNLMKNYCSKNITVYSLKNIERSLKHNYHFPIEQVLPALGESPFATDGFRRLTENPSARSTELDYAIKAFRSFCSWGGEVDDYRMLAPYVSNRFIMAYVIKHMMGLRDSYEEVQQKIIPIPDSATAQVACDELICRRMSANDFRLKFPLSVGSTGLYQDLSKLYCGHFRYQNYSSNTSVPQVKEWIKESDLEDPIFETNFFISLMTGVPDPLMGMEKYNDLPFIAKSSIDERWNHWSRQVLSSFSKDLLFEEALKVKAVPRRNRVDLALNGFKVNFRVTLGEMDRLMDDTDKLSMKFEIKLSKNYLRSLRIKWAELAREVDTEGQRAFKQEIAAYINIQLNQKEALLRQRVWNEEFSRFVSDELLEQVLSYRGPLFDSYQDEILTIPVKFSYGLFALGYLRYRADVDADQIKLNL